MIEAKEGLVASDLRESIARLTYQRFFRRYLRLAGMTGTGAEVAAELRAVFGFNTLRIPTHRPCVRRRLGERVYLDAQCALGRSRRPCRADAPGGARRARRHRSVWASEHLSRLLSRQASIMLCSMPGRTARRRKSWRRPASVAA